MYINKIKLTNFRNYEQQEIKLENLQQDTQRLKEENDKAQTDEYLEKLAREKLSMIKNGEFSVVNKTSK